MWIVHYLRCLCANIKSKISSIQFFSFFSDLHAKLNHVYSFVLNIIGIIFIARILRSCQDKICCSLSGIVELWKWHTLDCVRCPDSSLEPLKYIQMTQNSENWLIYSSGSNRYKKSDKILINSIHMKYIRYRDNKDLFDMHIMDEVSFFVTICYWRFFSLFVYIDGRGLFCVVFRDVCMNLLLIRVYIRKNSIQLTIWIKCSSWTAQTNFFSLKFVSCMSVLKRPLRKVVIKHLDCIVHSYFFSCVYILCTIFLTKWSPHDFCKIDYIDFE